MVAITTKLMVLNSSHEDLATMATKLMILNSSNEDLAAMTTKLMMLNSSHEDFEVLKGLGVQALVCDHHALEPNLLQPRVGGIATI